MANITFPKDAKLSKELQYRHLVARGESLKNVDDGTIIEIKSLVAYDNDDGMKVISILGSKWNAEKETFDPNITHYVSNSSIFRTELEKIVEIFGAEGITIRIRKYESKGGRTYVTCELA